MAHRAPDGAGGRMRNTSGYRRSGEDPTAAVVVSGGPGPDAAEALGRDPQDQAGVGGRGAGWEDDVWAEGDVGQALEQRRRAPLLDRRPAVDDEVLLEAPLVDAGALDRQRHARVALGVARLAARRHVAADDVLAVEAGPHDADLRAAVGVERDEVDQR